MRFSRKKGVREFSTRAIMSGFGVLEERCIHEVQRVGEDDVELEIFNPDYD
ncbi:hypothetical protein [Psychrobacillus insolitus]|uniref:hypothetical protein n=1 Tax=Psychrobacillus insolitus TaxID=1461 RepID=UPI001473E981|nr:hypothetical protein [Psychrobacillus insolitus]